MVPVPVCKYFGTVYSILHVLQVHADPPAPENYRVGNTRNDLPTIVVQWPLLLLASSVWYRYLSQKWPHC